MARLYLDTNQGELERIAQAFAATQKQVDAAARRAVSKLGRWVKSASMREVSRDTGVPRKVLKRRLLMSISGTRHTARVWYGLNAIPLSALSPRQTATGVTAGAGVAPPCVHRGARRHQRAVYRRVHKDQRLPLAVQYLNIADDVRRVLRVDINPRFRAMFARYFEQELRWEQRRAGA